MSEINENKREILKNNMVKALPVLRTRLNMTQEELSKRIGITRQTLIKIEAGKTPISWITFLALYVYFNSYSETSILLSGLGIDKKDLHDSM